MAISQGIAVCLLLSSATAAVPTLPSIGWQILGDGGVVSGSTVTVQVDSAPQFPASVRLIIDGVLRDSDEVTTSGGTCVLDVPTGTSGLDWKIEVQSGSETDAQSGTVG